jgi:cytochrome c-type biogenesis protein CcmH/NrfF
MIDNIWFFAVALGPVLLGAAIVYAMMRRRRLSRVEEARQKSATRDLYDKPMARTE